MIKTKKHLGQHFLRDVAIAQKIVELLPPITNQVIVEVGPGTGALTHWLQILPIPLHCIEIDARCVAYLRHTYPHLKDRIHQADFLKFSLSKLTNKPIVVIGNFPYHISTPLLFAILAQRQQVQTVVCMLQHEVAVRITAQPGSKAYGIPSVLLQAFYGATYHFQVPPDAFMPPPRVDSGVVVLQRNKTHVLPCDEALFAKVVKMAFRQRRKKLYNNLKPFGMERLALLNLLWDRRAETLSVAEFIWLTQCIAKYSECNIA